MKRAHISLYNAQQLAADIKKYVPKELQGTRWWWTKLPPRWDHWTGPQLNELVKAIYGDQDARS